MKWAACALVVVLATPAFAHQRPAQAISVHVRDAQHLIAGTTFGLVTSDDGGATWRWTCEQGLHYQDPYDPDYAYASDGTILVQTSVAMWLKRDLCGDDVMPVSADISAVEAGPDGALYAAAYDGTIYKAASSTASFTPIPAPATVVQWTSIEVAPGDAQRIYLAGFRMNGTAKEHVLMLSTNGGTSWSPMSSTGFPTKSSSLLYVAGIGTGNTVYVYSPYEDDDSAAIYVSTNAGTSWTKIFSSQDPYGLAFLARASGELVVATRASGAWRSTNGGTNWDALAGAPHISATSSCARPISRRGHRVSRCATCCRRRARPDRRYVRRASTCATTSARRGAASSASTRSIPRASTAPVQTCAAVIKMRASAVMSRRRRIRDVAVREAAETRRSRRSC
jgi:photosystem II stability/assembly factor-like uncharacterized protein